MSSDHSTVLYRVTETPKTFTTTALPTKQPTVVPTKPPTTQPTMVPTKPPTTVPTKQPSGSPTLSPTLEPEIELVEGSLEWCTTQAKSLGLPFSTTHKSNGAPAGCVRYNDGRVIFVENCINHENCGTDRCNGCSLLAPLPFSPTTEPTAPESEESHCWNYEQRKTCKKDSECTWVTIEPSETVGGIFNPFEKKQRFCVAAQCSILTKKVHCEKRGCMWKRKECSEMKKETSCGDRLSMKSCNKAGCKWHKRDSVCVVPRQDWHRLD